MTGLPLKMGLMRIRHTSHAFGWQSSHSVDLAGWQAKMASIEIGYHDVMRTSPIVRTMTYSHRPHRNEALHSVLGKAT